MRTVRRAGFALLITAAAVTASAPTVTALDSPLPPGVVTADVEAAVQRITAPLDSVALPPLPVNPVDTLVTLVNSLSAALGFPVDHGPAIRGAGMSDDFAGRVALLVQAVIACGAGTDRLSCAVAVNDAAVGVIRMDAPFFGDVQAWPVLSIDGDGSDDRYVHDYIVLIDRGGNDVYDNNAGGNLVDITRGPPGSAAPIVAPAIGCEQVQGNFPAPTATAHDCIAEPQVVLLDIGSAGRPSNDVYGVFKAPRTTDHNPPATGPRLVDGDCTSDNLIRRIVLQGSGFEGNGLVIDVGGNDKYRGKTAAQGSGHVGGIGILRDLGGGNDNYLAIRNSQGFSLVGILGVIQDDGGNDRYHTYMPSPIDPTAAFQEPGSGGVVDDTGVCDNLPRMVQGAALLGGVGFLFDEDGEDRYVGAPVDTQPFAPGILFFHSSQGFGCDGGIGILNDRGTDRDRYEEGPEGRQDGASITEAEERCFAAPGLSVFRDDGGTTKRPR